MYKASLLMVALAAAFSIPDAAHAATVSRIAQAPAAAACQLSIPTTDTGVRPKANGYRNEGTTSAFAICGIENPAQLGVKSATITFYSMDDLSHTFSCTGVNGWPDSGSFIYSTKSVTATSSTLRTSLQFAPSDFGGAGPYLPKEGLISVTCTLPSNVSVGYMYLSYDEDVGA